jgi:glycosyltransferase involved in cell wall biosynthesis
MPEKRVVLYDLGILATSTRGRGIGRYVSELARGLVALQHEWGELEIVFLERIGRGGRITLSHELEPTLARMTERQTELRYRWAYPLRLFAGRAARCANASLLHLPVPGATPLWAGNVRSVVTCHDLIPYKYPDHYAALEDGFRWGRRALDRRRYGTASHVIAISRATARDLERLLGLGPERVSVVPSGVDRTRWSAQCAESDAPHLAKLGLAGRRFMLYVGDGDWRKNAPGMLQALAEARRSDPSIELVWAGTMSLAEYDRERRANAESHGVEKACHFLGYVADDALGALYRAALGTLLVSRAEGFGYPVLEAMAAGCAVIASNTSSLPEVAGDAALLVDPESPARIAQAIAVLARDPERRRELISRGARHVENFSLEAQARGTLAVYRAILARTKVVPRRSTVATENAALCDSRRNPSNTNSRSLARVIS